MAKATKIRKDAKMVKEPCVEDRLTLKTLDAISSDDDDGHDEGGKDEWTAEEQALRQAIADGAFHHLLVKSKGKGSAKESDEDDIYDKEHEHQDSDHYDSDGHNAANTEMVGANDNDTDNDDRSDNEEKDSKGTTSVSINGKAVAAVYEELQITKKGMPWSELFVVIADEPLPFGGPGADGSPLDIHDDLKRELAFYEMALNSANEARIACKQAGIPFSRPEDFFAEMIKTDGESTPS